MMEQDVAHRNFSIIIAAYNEEEGIGSVLSSLVARYGGVAEIIVVNDGSTDKTEEVVKGVRGVRLISHRRNYGYGAALKMGVLEATTGTVCFLDADGQHSAEDVQKLIDAMDDAEMVVGQRGKGSHINFLRAPGKFVLKAVSTVLANQEIPDLNSGLRAVDRNLLLHYIHILPDGFSASTTMTMLFLSKRFSVKWVPIVTRKRVGTSQVRIVRDGTNTIILLFKIIMMFNPLRVFLPLSIGSVSVGMAYGFGWVFFVEHKGFPVGALLITLFGFFSFVFGLLADQISAIRQERFEGISSSLKRRKKSGSH